MARTFKDTLAFDASSVFLNTNDFAETATHFKAGSSGNTERIVVIVDRDDEANNNIGPGDQQLLDDERGAQIRRGIKLEMLATVEVSEETTNSPSVFELEDGTLCTAIRVIGRDSAMQTVLCNQMSRRATRKAQ